MYKSILLFLFPFLLLFPSCKKELTLPAKVIFEFGMISYENEENDLKNVPPVDIPKGRILIDRGTLSIESIEFDGRRDEGRDVFFVSDLRQALTVDLETGQISQPLSFDIPQGVYNRVELFFELGGDDNIPFLLEGSIRLGHLDEIPLRFEYNIREQIRIRAEPGKRSDKIVLRKDTPSTARVVVDAGAMFEFVNMGMIRNASLSAVEGENMILINSGMNNDIFNSIANRLEKSFRVVID
ncbi:MAG: hypothetical protein R6U58_01585 [Bacteroidales bacterium]